METDAATIAASLTAEQRQALLSHADEQSWGSRYDKWATAIWSGCGHVLREYRLIEFVSETSSNTKLTARGLAVRRELERNGK